MLPVMQCFLETDPCPESFCKHTTHDTLGNMSSKEANIEQWAQKITKEIYSEYKNHYCDWDYGIKVFYSRVTENPPLVLISYQPGGDSGYYDREDRKNFESKNFLPPKSNVYLNVNNDMSER